MRPIREAILGALAWRLGIHVVRVYRLDLGGPARPVRPDGLEVRPLGCSELLAAAADPRMDLPASMAEAALARGDVCVGALEQGSIVGYMWIALGTTPHARGVQVSIPDDASWWYKVFVREDRRGRGIAGALYGYRDGHLIRRGSALLGVAAHNRPSISSATRAGFREVGFLAYWRPAGRLWTLHSPGAKRSGLRFAATAEGR